MDDNANNAVQQSQFVYLNGCASPVLSRLAFTVDEPFTVALAFRVEPGEWVEWEFARDLLLTGLSEPAGIGDIRIRPDLSAQDDLPDGNGDVLVIELESPDGYATVEISRQDVCLFLDETLSRVPPGSEGRHLDLDAVIANLTTARP
ncbi:SsgA family sporulation/cell division regulator [Saccharomonospora iraqiensis]|uniref:SsgA family sporulation/cell division regulator n=1 Tax=Saccharomonospora iraqiensis TaxID=52698 RepID=UPI00040E4B7F|nr:SsgA family sporulation/cell division regulator [Saccharomonospora iraqiensis]